MMHVFIRSEIILMPVFLKRDLKPSCCCCKMKRIFIIKHSERVSPLFKTFCVLLQLFSVIPHQFLPGIKSPCWYERFSGDLNSDPYRKNHFSLRSKSFKTVSERLKRSFQQHLLPREGSLFRFRCLPFFYIIGQPKCGTTDLFHRLLLHPEIKVNTMKEPHWWTRKRFGKSSEGQE